MLLKYHSTDPITATSAFGTKRTFRGASRFDLSQGRKPLFALNWVGAEASHVMYTFLKIFIAVLLVLAVADWIAGRQAKNWTNIPNRVPAGWASLSSNITIRSAMANESPKGTAPLLDETSLPGDIEYENPNGNVRIYFPIVTALALSIVFTVILGVSRRA
jgi:hypothetical protein